MGAIIVLQVIIVFCACFVVSRTSPAHAPRNIQAPLRHQKLQHDPSQSPRRLMRLESKSESVQDHKRTHRLQGNFSLDEQKRCAGEMKLFSDNRVFEVWQESKEAINAPAVQGLKTAAQYYDYRAASSHTGLEVVGESFIFLYRDLNDDQALNLFFIHGKQIGDQGTASVDMSASGVPEGTKIVQADDGADEFGWADLETSSLGDKPSGKGADLLGKWRYARNTDGGAVALPVDVDWELEIHFQCTGHCDKWKYYFATGDHYDLNMDEPVFVRSRSQEVKAPSGPDLSQEDPQDEAGKAAKLDYMQRQFCKGSNKQMLLVNQKTEFCVLATSDAEGLVEYNFNWGDESPQTTMTGEPGALTCANHAFDTQAEEITIKVSAKDGGGCTSNKDLGLVCVAPVDLAGFEAEGGAESTHFVSINTWIVIAFSMLSVAL